MRGPIRQRALASGPADGRLRALNSATMEPIGDADDYVYQDRIGVLAHALQLGGVLLHPFQD